jgi:hypothetical protein
VKGVLVDRHHHALFHAMQRLFEDRLGYTVYTPLGHEWWDEGYWRFGEGYGDDRLAQQFLSLDRPGEWTPDSHKPCCREFVGYDAHHPDRPIRGIELTPALDREWAFVVATVQDNQQGFKRFADRVGARYVLQVGNTNQHVDWSLDPLALVSSEVPIRGKGIVIHQEMDPVFQYNNPSEKVYDPPVLIPSFVNCFGSTPCHRPFIELRDLLPQMTFCDHGIDGRDGNIETVAAIADEMALSLFGYHDKVQGDGFGHVLHDWAAIGRPLIGHGNHYTGLMGEVFWQDGVTCIDLDKHTVTEAAQMIRDIAADPPRHREMCRAIRAVFDANVDFAAEAERVREFLA